MVEGVNRSEIFRARPNLVCFQLEVCYFANMYIMRSDLLHEYLTFCFRGTGILSISAGAGETRAWLLFRTVVFVLAVSETDRSADFAGA